MIHIYKYTNLKTNNVYIGQSKDIIRRHKDHLKAFKGSNKCRKFYCALRSYGIEMFDGPTILETVLTREEADIRESFWIKKYPNNYNLTLGGYCGSKSEETKTIISSLKKGKSGYKHTLETKLHLSKVNKGKIRSNECKLKLSIIAKNRKRNPLTEDSKEKIRKRISRNWIIKFPNNEEIIIFNLTKFCKEHNLDQGHMSRVAQGKKESYKGFKCVKI